MAGILGDIYFLIILNIEMINENMIDLDIREGMIIPKLIRCLYFSASMRFSVHV
jgi:hypothetical protein